MLIVDTLLKEGKMSSIENFSRKQESLSFQTLSFLTFATAKKCRMMENVKTKKTEAQIEGKIKNQPIC